MFLVVDIGGPKASHSTVVGVDGEERRTGAAVDLIDVLHDDL
jgi:hypothetical protein